MNIVLSMIDTDTGEILSRQTREYALSFNTRNDAGFTHLMRYIQSAVRGVRCHKKNIEVRFHFEESKPLPQLPFGMTVDQANKQASQYVY